MKRKSFLLCTIVAVLFTIMSVATPAFAVGTGTLDDPYIGGNNYAHADASSIILHKLDIAQFEAAKTQELNLPTGVKVVYIGNDPTGASIGAGEVIGYYERSDNPGVKIADVTLGELASLSNITFYFERVQLSSGASPGSTTPGDYEPVPVAQGDIADYAKTDANGQIVWEGLPNGYYRITEQANDSGQPVDKSQYIVSVPMVNPANEAETVNTVYIYPKNRGSEGPVVEKDEPVVSDYNGNILSWTIRAEVPSYLKTTKGNQSYVITDTMDKGLRYANNLKVYYLSNTAKEMLTANTHYSAPAANGDTSLVVTLLEDGYAKLAGAIAANTIDKDPSGRYMLYVEYDTVVNIAEADFSISPENEVVLDFTNNDGSDYTNNDGPIPVEKYAGLRLYKKDGSNQNVLLPNAQFKIYTQLASGGTAVDENSVLKDALGAEIVFTTNNAGEFFYAGLGAGNYYIVETTPPSGYKKLNKFETIVITDANVEANDVLTATVLNYLDNTVTLPATGSTGTVIFIVIGLGLIILAAVLFLLNKRQSTKRKDDTK